MGRIREETATRMEVEWKVSRKKTNKMKALIYTSALYKPILLLTKRESTSEDN